MFGYGAAAALLVSFAALALFWPTPRLENGTRERVLVGPPGLPARILVGVVRAASLAFFVELLVAAAIGDNSARTNLTPVVVYIVFWVGMQFVSGLVGDVWQVLSPFDTLAAVGQWVRRGRAGRDADVDDDEEPGADDARPDWGYWPAALGILGFVWVELVYPSRAVPRAMFVMMVAYTVAVLAGAARWGRAWLREGEAFAGLFGVIAHVSPVYQGDDGRLRLRAPFTGLARLKWRPGLEALVLITLGSTSFDGLGRTRFWMHLTSSLSGTGLLLATTAGLLWAIGVVTIAYVGAMRVAARLVADRYSADELRAAFVHSLVPIALAYSVAHYFSLFALEGQATIALVSDPLGRGWDLFGTASHVVNFTLVKPRTVAYVQCASIVVGHVAGVVIAHDRALVLFDKRVATRSQYPLLAAMVLFTVGGLFLLLGG
jgi:hypothetical protein